jgi:hypothetical protein
LEGDVILLYLVDSKRIASVSHIHAAAGAGKKLPAGFEIAGKKG